LETEYGIQVDGVDDLDVVTESMELIRCYTREDEDPPEPFVALWDYDLENPRRDMRGFEVDELLQDSDETEHLQKDRVRKIPLKDLKSDLILANGARLYNDHTHPEYSTAECTSLFDLVAQDRAGEHIVLQCARRRTETRGRGTGGRGVVRLYKNNTDFEGHSYGCHENFLLPRSIPFDDVIAALLPFLVTRQIYAGAGKVGVEADGSRHDQGVFQLAQRSDFFEVIASIDTMTRRPLVNTRDEPHADPARYRRLHIIIGDANMCEWATALKVGALRLVLDLLEAGNVPALELADPVGAVKAVSRDGDRRWELELAEGTMTSAVDVQAAYLERARALAAGRDDETDWVLDEWQAALQALAADPMELVGRCDWVTKKWLLDAFAESEGLDWDRAEDRAWLQSQDLEYHNIDPEEGLYLMLEGAHDGSVLRLCDEARIEAARVTPPRGTRAWFRGHVLEKFGAQVRSLNWDSIEFDVDGRVRTVDLRSCVDADTAAIFNTRLDQAGTVQELLAALASTPTAKEAP
jgi:proteasome accessory factor A